MPREISDEMLEAFAVTATLDELPDRLVTRYAGLLDRVTLYKPFVAGKDEAGWQALVNGMHDSAHGPTNRLRGSVLAVE